MKHQSGLKLARMLVYALTAGSAWAGTITFSYQLDGGGPVLAGTMNGALQADLNTFVVTSMGPVTYGASPGPALLFSDSLDHFTFNTPALATVTMNGIFMDFIACADVTCADGFLFAAANLFSATARGGIADYEDGVSFGLVSEVYNPERWSATAIPEPGTLSLGLMAAALALFVRLTHLRKLSDSALLSHYAIDSYLLFHPANPGGIRLRHLRLNGARNSTSVPARGPE